MSINAILFKTLVFFHFTISPLCRTANLLSKVLARGGGTLDNLTDEFFFLLVRNNVHGDSIIFGSAIAIEPGVYRFVLYHAIRGLGAKLL